MATQRMTQVGVRTQRMTQVGVRLRREGWRQRTCGDVRAYGESKGAAEGSTWPGHRPLHQGHASVEQ